MRAAMPRCASCSNRSGSLANVAVDTYVVAMTKNVYRFRKLKWGDPEKPWLKRGSPLPVGETAPGPRRWLDSPWMIIAGFALAFGLGVLMLS